MSTTYTLSGSVVALVGEPISGGYTRMGVSGRVEAWGGAHVGTTAGESGQVRLGSWPITINSMSGAWSVSGLPATGDGMGWAPSYQALRVVFEWSDPGTGKSRTWASEYFELTADATMADVATWTETQVQTAAYWAGVAEAAAESVDGRSAYQIAVDEGFVGTVEEWLASLEGAAGADGAMRLRSGAGAPGSGLGSVADWYLDTDTGQAYEKVDSTTWEPRANLTGPQGIEGPQGPEGPEGPEGPQGEPGAGSVSSVNGDAGPAVVLDAADVGAVPTGRTITAGSGLTGGGDLTANRSLAVNFGTTAGTVAAGDDPRFTAVNDPTVAAMSGTTGTITASLALGRHFTVTLTGDPTIAFSNVPAAGKWIEVRIVVTNGTAGTRNITHPSGTTWMWPNSSAGLNAGQIPTGRRAEYTYRTTDGGTTWLASMLLTPA